VDTEDRKGGLVISDRPQISVELVNKVEIEITVSGIGDDFARVETNTVIIPADCAKEVAEAILALVKR